MDTEDKTARHLERPTVPALDAILGDESPILDHGFIRVIDYMGDQAAITQAARVSYGKGTKTVQEDRGLLRYLLRHHHTTPFEMCEIKLHVKLPIFVARQWIRHRTANVNEYSARYSIMLREFHVPDVGDVARQSTANKQGRADDCDDLNPAEIREIMRSAMNQSFDDYEALVDEEGEYKLARETAREVLPMSTYTEWYWKVDLHNLMHFLRLRADPHAQKEIRVYAERICEILKLWVPDVFDAFEDYVLGSHTFSKVEMKMLRHTFEKLSGGMLWSSELTTREVAEFNKALGLGRKK